VIWNRHAGWGNDSERGNRIARIATNRDNRDTPYENGMKNIFVGALLFGAT
jgi:hypothetical protein